MNNLNTVLVEGFMTGAPEFKTTQKGTEVCTFTIESHRYYVKEPGCDATHEVSRFNIEIWSNEPNMKDVDYIGRAREKGTKKRGVRIVGRLKQYSWQDLQGKTHEKVVIVAEHVEFRYDKHLDKKEVQE